MEAKSLPERAVRPVDRRLNSEYKDLFVKRVQLVAEMLANTYFFYAVGFTQRPRVLMVSESLT